MSDMVGKIEDTTIALILIAILLIPIGVKMILGINKTAYNIVPGSITETIVDNIVPLALVGILLALVFGLKTKGKGRK